MREALASTSSQDAQVRMLTLSRLSRSLHDPKQLIQSMFAFENKLLIEIHYIFCLQ
jgi:hypothetical protein